MSIKSITFRNYRSFGSAGATLPLTDEFVGIVGVNNSGKSSLLKAIFELRPLFINFAGSIDSAVKGLGSAGWQLGQLELQQGERIFPTWDAQVEPRITLLFEEEPGGDETSISEVTFILSQPLGLVRIEVSLFSGARTTDPVEVSQTQQAPAGKQVLRLSFADGVSTLINWDERTRDFKWLALATYIGPFRNAVNSGGGSYYDLQIGKDFITQFNNFKSGPNAKDNEAVQAMTDSIADIFGVGRLEISAAPDGTQLVFSLDGTSYRGSELGAGIMQFVVVAANVLVKRPTLLLIDEPELSLHASLQVKFLSLLARSVTGPTVFASHSLGLTRSIADTILVSSKDATGISTLADYRAASNLALTLGELGYGGLHDTAYKAVLLVEGATEVRVFQELLSKYNVKNEVVLVTLGGDSMATGNRDLELAELRKLAENVYAVVDSERTTATAEPIQERQDFSKSCEAQGIKYLILERRATENYLDQTVAATVMKIPEVSFGHFDKPPAEWSKPRNWRIAKEMSRDDLSGTDLDSFLSKLAAQVGA